MILSTVKEVLRNWLDDNEKDKENTNPRISRILAIHRRLKESDKVSPDMLVFSDRLVYNYLPAIEASFIACEGSDESLRVSRIKKDITEIKETILSSIESCLIDIEHGTVFADNLSSPFVNCLLDFESYIDAREVV